MGGRPGGQAGAPKARSHGAACSQDALWLCQHRLGTPGDYLNQQQSCGSNILRNGDNDDDGQVFTER